MRRVSLLGLALLCATTPACGQRAKWTFRTGGPVVSSPAVASGVVFIGSADGKLYAVDAASGRERWHFVTGGAVDSSPLTDGRAVYFGSRDGNVYAVSASDGALLWKFRTGGEKRYDTWDYYLSSPRFFRNTIVVGSGDGSVYELDRRTGREVWRFVTGDVVHAEPAVADGRVYIGSFDGNFYAIDAVEGSLVWKFKTVGDAYFPKGEVQKGAAVTDGAVYFGSRDYNVYALDAEHGTGHWNMKEGGSWVVATPLVHDGTIFFGTSDSHHFYAMGAEYGGVRWRMPLNMRVYGSAVPHGEDVVFGCFNGKLYSVNAATGKVDWIFQTDASKRSYADVIGKDGQLRPDFPTQPKNQADVEMQERKIYSLGAILSTPAIDGNTVYFGSTDGMLYAVELPR